MRVAIVHYHLDPGGVTTVIRAACSALTGAGISHVILTGSANESLPGHRTVPGLGYLADADTLSAAELTSRLRMTACEALGAVPDVWHFHNHSLGKNCLVPLVISRLAMENEAIVLQIHDLAEQGRPGNYPLVAGIPDLYPFSSRICYAFLNSRDTATFTAAGLPAENALILPNPIAVGSPAAPISGEPLLLAPVRGIRRKNLGELVLLSVLAPPGTRIAVSRAPENPLALPIHNHWRDFAIKHRLPIGFSVVDQFAPASGAATTFESWIHHATHFVTTSVSEGFGLTFLESIANGKPLVGRNLPHLTRDHARHGIRTGRFYDSILIPIEWVDLTLLRDHLTIDMERDHRLYQRRLTQQMIETALASLVRDGQIDFGNLPEPLQQGIIERLANPSERSVPVILSGIENEPATNWLAATLAERSPSASPEQLAPYSLESYQKSISSLYARLSEAPTSTVSYVPPNEILTSHLRPENFHFLLSSLRPDSAPKRRYRAAIFDIYGTLLIAPAGGVKPDPLNDPVLRDVLRNFGYEAPASPSADLHRAILRHHAEAVIPYPEVDVRKLWREILGLGDDVEMTYLVQAIEEAWHPAKPMPSAGNFVSRLARSGISLGLLSNAQCNTLPSLGPIVDLFAPELTLLSYQHGMSKPSPELFSILCDRLAGRGISPEETLFIGNDPVKDILPAAHAGFRTALFIGHPDSIRSGDCVPDHTFSRWSELLEAIL